MTHDEQGAGILVPDPPPILRKPPGAPVLEDVPLVHGRVLASTRGYATIHVPDPEAEYGVRIDPVDIEEHFVDVGNDRALLRMRLRASLGEHPARRGRR